MQIFTIEMLPNLCTHCAKHHLNRQEKRQEPEGNGKNIDTINIQKSNWPLFTSARKKLNKIRDLLQNEYEHCGENDAMHLINRMAYDSNNHNNDQLLQRNTNAMTKTQSSHIAELSIRNGASMLIAESSKMNGINNDVNRSLSNGAFDVHRHGLSEEMQPNSWLDDPTTKPSACMPLSTLRCSQCGCCIDDSDSTESSTQPSKPLGRPNSFSLNVHNEKNPSSFSENVYRSATNCSNLRGCVNANEIDSSDSSCSIRKPSGNYLNNHRRRQHVSHQWPFAISSTMNFSHVLLICITFMVFSVRNALVLAETNNTIQTETSETGICSSKDIRNSVRNFNQLKNCRVIEGFLMITLIDKYNETDYEGLTFPELTEITEFLLLYRVNGLTSLSQLFPNLRIIRGNTLLHDSAFIIFEMMHLQEIGLKSLVKISRGNVRIAKNPVLCFVETVDWSLITLEGKSNIFLNNKATNECATCPGKTDKNDKTISDPSKTNSELVCPDGPNGKKLCWSRQECQTFCDPKCGNSTCNAKGECCNDSCLGCSDDDVNVCLSCRYLSIVDKSGRQCVEKCPATMYAHESRRCVTAPECRAIKKPVFLKYDFNLLDLPYIPHDGICRIDCPSNFYPDGLSGQRVCTQCVGSCKKECPPANIESISSAQRYKGCTHINGPFTLSIRNPGGHNVVRELETFLSDIEVIEGPLSIVRSYPILSLGFFKKLRIIKGDITGKLKYGLKVLENQNLQALFTQNVTVERGRMFFHFNPKLCMNIIQEFKDNVTELRNVSILPIDEVAANSNGDKTACNVTELNVRITTISYSAVVMELTPLPYDDERQLLGYLLHYMPAPYKNVTMYDGRDACGGDSWQIDDIIDSNRNSTPITILAPNLKPFTQYAYFIRTYTVASEQKGGLSPIQYFRTAPYKPDAITKLAVSANGSSEISIKWAPPVHANGNLTKYIIKCTMNPDNPQLLEYRNYCDEPLGPDQAPIPIPKPNEVINKPPKDIDSISESGCSCEATEGKTDRINFSNAEENTEQLNQFEDELHNTVYVRQESIRQRRDLSGQSYPIENELITLSKTRWRHRRSTNSTPVNSNIFPPDTKNPADPKTNNDETNDKMDPTGTYYIYVYREVNASVFSLTLDKLKHYSYYSITVKACREGEGDTCGTDMIAYQRTGKIEDADDITNLRVEKLPASNHSTGVRLSWDEPKNPNGIIVSYNIRYQRMDIEHGKPVDYCIPQNLYHNQSKSHTIPDLANGNYSFTVLANSLAGSSGRWSHPVYAKVDEPALSPGMIALILVLILLVVSGIVALAWFYRRRYGPPDSGIKIIASVNPEYVSMQYTPDEWEIPRDKIIQMKELGQGSFGMVYEGVLVSSQGNGERVRCAIKTVNENATDRERINFLKEAGVMKAFDTHHVVRLLGVVSRGQPVLVIMELMVNGDLKGFLRSHRPDSSGLPESGNEGQPPTLRQILQMAIEIADGMAYLSAKKFVHRDLAARNCMVAEDYTVKIGDFGMTRDIYETDYYRKGTKGLLPVRWMAPESLKDGVFSSSSDVFSFGIVLWEMATLASQPYQGLSNDQVLRYVIDGGVMERPENCPERLYSLMCRCWQHRPSARPTFIQIITMLLDEAKPNFLNVSFYGSSSGQELLQLPQHQLLEVVDVRTPLRAEEENFSVGVDDDDDADPNSFLMENRNISRASASASVPSNSR
ncbi:insulin-like receptor isoform X2 [Contarinia nasturtii]|nr:insulin-like receptor isoform X2 [Contarinia nasturtii]